MVDQKKVKPLFELASVATYHRIISQIEHQLRSSPTTANDVGASSTCQPKKKRKVDSFYVYSNKYKPPNIVKAQVDEYLVVSETSAGSTFHPQLLSPRPRHCSLQHEVVSFIL